MGARSTAAYREITALLSAEFIGTLLFQLLGGGAGGNILGPFINGLTLICLVFTFADVSGAHFNPVVSLAMVISGDMGLFKAAAYIVCQISGATTGALLLVALSKDLKVRQNDQRVCFEGSGLSAGQVFGWEALLTFLLLLVIYAVAVNRPAPKNSAPPTTPSTVTAPLAIGLVVTSIALVAGGLTGGFFNPARYLAPIIAHGCNGRRWAVYIGAQMLGAIAAAICNGMLWRKHAQAGYGDMEMGAPVMVERLLVS